MAVCSPSQPLAAPGSPLQPRTRRHSPWLAPCQVGFVIYNAGDTLGRNLPGAVRSPRWLLGLTLLRTVFVPLFMMCNVVPSSGASPPASPPLASDAWPLLVMAAFSLSNGWLTSCALMHAPEAVPPSERGRAGWRFSCIALRYDWHAAAALARARGRADWAHALSTGLALKPH